MKMNKCLKTMLPMAIGAMIMVSGVTPAFATDKVETTGANLTFQEYIEKEYANEFKDVNNKDMKSLEKLYNEANVLEKGQNYNESDKKWEDFHNIFDKYVDEDKNCSKMVEDEEENYEPETFKEFIKYFDKTKINNKDMKDLEILYNKTIALEKTQKYDQLDETWKVLDLVLSKYVEDAQLEETDSITEAVK